MAERSADSHPMRRTWLEAAGWIAGVTLLWTLDTMSKFAEKQQTGIGKEDFRIVTEQASSGVAALIMIGFVIYWLRLFPLRRDALIPAIIGHTFGSIIFAFGHYSLQILLRGIVYFANDMSFIWREPFVNNLLVEYQKDIKIYLAIVIIVSAYQYYRATKDKALPSQTASKKLIVQTGSGEAVVRFEDIHHLEASRNYVVVHTADKEYLIRDTVANLEKKLPTELFARAHRSYIVNIERIAEIRTVDGGYRIRLENDRYVPLSRSYRDALKARVSGE